MIKEHAITRLKPIWAIDHPQALLQRGNQTFTPDDKVRVFFVREVKYAEDGSILWSIPRLYEKYWLTLVEFYEDNPSFKGKDILDYDNNLQIWSPV